jgi:hypothetical protein
VAPNFGARAMVLAEAGFCSRIAVGRFVRPIYGFKFMCVSVRSGHMATPFIKLIGFATTIASELTLG